jgi:hypothetical protein
MGRANIGIELESFSHPKKGTRSCSISDSSIFAFQSKKGMTAFLSAGYLSPKVLRYH